jgi:hypothetical protein
MFVRPRRQAILSSRSFSQQFALTSAEQTHGKENPNAQLVLVSAWATDKGLLLGQVKTDIKSNEITAIPRLLDMIRVKDCLISIDAAGCQTKIAEKISGLGGEYLLALKGNQGTLGSDVEAFFQDAFANN